MSSCNMRSGDAAVQLGADLSWMWVDGVPPD